MSTVTRKKLPAYAKALLDERRAGRHPWVVDVIYGGHWDAPDPEVPRLAVRAGDALGLDWSAVAGVGVRVFHRAAVQVLEWSPGAEAVPEVLTLLGEIALVAGDLQYSPDGRPDHLLDVAATAHAARVPRHGKLLWPAWWSDEIEARFAGNEKKYFDQRYRATARLLDDAGRRELRRLQGAG